MEKIENELDKQLNSKNYRGWEKFEHETNMRFKAWSVEQGIYHAPALFIFIIYFSYGIIRDIDLPYSESFVFIDNWFYFWCFIAMIANTFSLKFFKPIFSKVMNKQIKEISEDVYLKGANFATTQEYNEQIKQYQMSEFEILNDKNIFDNFQIPLQLLSSEKDKRFEDNVAKNLNIPRISLSTGLCIMGSPGKGKSVLINRIIKQVPNNETTKSIIVDVKGEFVEKFYNNNTDYILCPADVRSVRFDLYKLIRTRVDAAFVSEILVPDDKQTQDPHWTAAARAIMEGVLIYSSKHKLSNLQIFELTSNHEKLIEIKEDEEVLLIVGNYLRSSSDGKIDKETASILSSLARKAKTLQYLKYLDELKDNDIIELKKWLQNGKGGKLFLLATENLSKVFSPLYGVIISYLMSNILDSNDNRNLNFYFFLDELPQLGKALGENLEKALAVGRSKGIKIVMAMQSYSQIKKEFGEKEAESILDTTNSYIVFQSNIGAQFLEKYFGKTTVLRNDESFSFGMDSMADRVTVSRKEVKENLIDDAEINRLKTFEFYAKIEGCSEIVKSRLAPKFIKKGSTEKYIENPNMTIKSISQELKYIIKRFNNNLIDTLNVPLRAKINKATVKAIF